ncbi:MULTISPECIES: hypothetical protein [Roseomonadaceae]|uniref:Uncharacterized protein n=1 Tax=Falsiroseomonas oleicola TaxID=2801474 RepID=A0ABS6H227_9PROT|nr:hypothetical protein [Roseomonas oleicola]MBU8542715.1 hypothetical protein [Roseomonas oleicola]
MRVTMMAAALCALGGAALAQPMRDPTTGLSVTPPPNYQASVAPPRAPYAAIFRVRRPDDRDTGCQVAFAEAPGNAGLSQDRLNETMQSPEWRDTVIRTMSALYDIQQQETYRQGEVAGLLMEGMIRPRDGIPARAQQIRTLFVVLETPRGRTTTVCVGEVSGFAERRPEFLAVTKGAESPR